MDLFQYWDSVEEFTASEVAYLVLGIEPQEKLHEELSGYKNLIRRMKLSFLDSCAHMRYCTENERDWGSFSLAWWFDEEEETVPFMSVAMLELAFQCDEAADGGEYGQYIYYPPARIKELREEGDSIRTQWMITTTETGDDHRIGLYVLESEVAHEPA